MKLLVVAVGLFFAFQSEAQNVVTSKTPKMKPVSSRPVLSQITPQLAYTGSTLEGNDNHDTTGHADGVSAGVGIDISRSNIVFETGLLYRQMGGVAYLLTEEQARRVGLTDRIEAEIDLSYLVVPLMAKYYFNGRAKGSFIAHAGLQPSFLVFKDLRPKSSINIQNKDMSNINDFDLIGAVGMGFQIPISKNTLAVLQGTYLRGITPVYNNVNIFHNSFVGTLGLGILL